MTKLYFEENFIGLEKHYPIVDENGNEKYYLDQGVVITKYKSEVSYKDGSSAMTIERTKTFGSTAYLVSFESGLTMDVKRDKSSQILAQVGDKALDIGGDFKNFNLSFNSQEGQSLGRLIKTSKNGTMYYEITIDDDSYEQILVGLAICIANMANMKGSTAIIMGSSV